MVEKYPLTEGALRVIMRGGQVDEPIMQVLGSKKIVSGQSEKDRYRILLSDGKYLISFAMLTTQINEKLTSGDLDVFSVVKIKRYITSIINNSGRGGSDKRVLVILDMELIVPGSQVNEKIGNPEQLPDQDCEQQNGTPVNGVSNVGGPRPNAVVRPTSSDLNQSVALQDQLTHPISSLSPYQNKWVIKARVTNKSAIRTWSNSRGEGKLFSIDLLDESGEIRATIFRDQVDKFYDMIEVDKVYYLSKCQVKLANKQFSSLKNDFEMTFNNDTILQVCHEEVESIPQTQFNFTPIDKIAGVDVGSTVEAMIGNANNNIVPRKVPHANMTYKCQRFQNLKHADTKMQNMTMVRSSSRSQSVLRPSADSQLKLKNVEHNRPDFGFPMFHPRVNNVNAENSRSKTLGQKIKWQFYEYFLVLKNSVLAILGLRNLSVIEQERHNSFAEEYSGNNTGFSCTSSDNTDLLFFKSLLPHMENFTNPQKLEIKTEIIQMILQKQREKEEHGS